MIDFTVTKQDDGRFLAILKDRACAFDGDTEHDAIANLVQGAAELALRGSMDPLDPSRRGVPPLQHVLRILTDCLGWHVKNRRDHIALLEHDRGPGARPPEVVSNPEVARINETISGLATAIAAVARVKEL